VKPVYPGLYAAASQSANAAQRLLFSLSRLNVVLLVSASLLAATGSNPRVDAIIGAILFGGILALVIYQRVESLQRKWYQARALAESVKTATWRLACGAEPFDSTSSETNFRVFGGLLEDLLRDNKTLGVLLAGDAARSAQITPWMRWMLEQELATRKRVYLVERVRDQRAWYASRSSWNRRASSKSFALLVTIYAIAIFLHLLRVSGATTVFWAIPPLTVLATGMISWRQLKRYDELASAYALTAHEVGIIESRLEAISTAADLGRFVSDAENAFSREHTQWAARRDH
jgi:hypothetical protein